MLLTGVAWCRPGLERSSSMELELHINGVVESMDVTVNETLLSMLRREGYCSVKQGCETGECGACTVLVDGVPRPSCVMLAGQAGGCTITTVEWLGSTQKLHPLQQAFIEVGAVKCGFCTPGMLLSAHALLQKNPHPTEEEVKDALSGNLCRCTGYVKPVQAVMRAAAVLRGEQVEPVEYTTASYEESAISMAEKFQVGAAHGAAGGATTKIPVITTSGSGFKGARLDAALEVVGKPVSNIDGVRLATGKPSFTADVQPRGLLFARILSSPHAHATIRTIDVSEAKSLPGVHAVLTYKDVPRTPFSSVERAQGDEGPRDQFSLDYILRYVGDRVAVVAAETSEIAEEALSLIQVEYDVLPAVLDPRKALEEGVAVIHPETDVTGIYDATRNIAARVRAEVGDVEQGFAAADTVVEAEYFVPAAQPAPLENHIAVTYFDDDGTLVVRTSTQVPHHVHRTLAHILDMPSRQIRVVQPAVGGGFGLKQEIVLEDLCALLTVTTGRPVMLAYSRDEEFNSTRLRQQYVVRLKTGVKQDGTIVANQMILLASTGAHATHQLLAPNSGASEALALYPAPNMSYVAEILYTNQPPAAALRGYGAPQDFFALECHMDEVAKRIHLDPLEFRRRNWLKAGDVYPWLPASPRTKEAAPRIASCGLPECLRVVEEKLNWHTKRGRVGNGRFRRGVGLALSLHGNPLAPTGTGGAMIKLNEDGAFDIFVGITDGGGDAKTLLAQIAAESLGAPIASILLHTNETSMVPPLIGEGVLSSLYLSGGAVKRAAEQVRRQLVIVAGRMLNALPESLKVHNGVISAPNGQTLTIEQVVKHCLYVENRHIMTTASWKQPQIPTAFAAQGVEIEIDTETGSLRVISSITAVDAGRTINPMIAEGQIQGSVAQGLGMGLSEEMIYDQKGQAVTANLSDYHIYSAPDMPELQTYFVETNDAAGPFGAKEVAEIALNGVAPALANAVADALGIRIRQLPLTPERLLRAIHAQNTAR
jgi:putative selenate reductase molybdopterin-binding subunit